MSLEPRARRPAGRARASSELRGPRILRILKHAFWGNGWKQEGSFPEASLQGFYETSLNGSLGQESLRSRLPISKPYTRASALSAPGPPRRWPFREVAHAAAPTEGPATGGGVAPRGHAEAGRGPRGSPHTLFLQHLPCTFQLVKPLRFTPGCTPDNGHHVVWPRLPANPSPPATHPSPTAPGLLFLLAGGLSPRGGVAKRKSTGRSSSGTVFSDLPRSSGVASASHPPAV